MGLTAAGALLLWGAPLFAVESLYGDACVLLFPALILAGLSHLCT
jgi:hypothetical protein